MRSWGIGPQHQPAIAVVSKNILGVAAIAEWLRRGHAARHLHPSNSFCVAIASTTSARFHSTCRGVGPTGQRAARRSDGGPGKGGATRWGEAVATSFKIRPRVFSLPHARGATQWATLARNPLAGQSASHMQAEQARVGLHITHASPVVVQPIDGQHQVGHLDEARSRILLRPVIAGEGRRRGRSRGRAGVTTNGSPRAYARCPLPELGLGAGGRSGRATSRAATGRSRVDNPPWRRPGCASRWENEPRPLPGAGRR